MPLFSCNYFRWNRQRGPFFPPFTCLCCFWREKWKKLSAKSNRCFTDLRLSQFPTPPPWNVQTMPFKFWLQEPLSHLNAQSHTLTHLLDVNFASVAVFKHTTVRDSREWKNKFTLWKDVRQTEGKILKHEMKLVEIKF